MIYWAMNILYNFLTLVFTSLIVPEFKCYINYTDTKIQGKWAIMPSIFP